MKKEIITGVITLTFLLLANFAIAQIDIIDSTPPSSTVTHFTNFDEDSNAKECNQENKAYLNYDDVVGHGISEDDESSIIEVQTKLDNFASFLAACDDNSCKDGDLSENWHTQTYTNLEEGWHNLSARAKDDSTHEEQFSSDNTCMFCIDKSPPGTPGMPVHEDKDTDDEDGFDPSIGFDDDTGLTFEWTEASSTGCAVIDHYEVEVYFSNGTLWKIRNTTDDKPRITISGAKNNEDFFIRVRAVDKAGNPGSWSEDSDEVNVDTENPTTDVSNGDDDGWKSSNFDVHFKDEDSERWGLELCQYKLSCGNFDSDWINRECSGEEPITQEIDISNLQIEGTCQVSSRAVDLAGNVGTDDLTVNIDRLPPQIKITLGEPNYMKETDSFVTTDTEITISAEDAASGVKSLCYSINGAEPKCPTDEEESSDTFKFEEESMHTLSISVMDDVGNANSSQQIFFVDNAPPLTTKTYIKFFQEVNTWVIEHLPVSIMNFVFDWLSPSSEIILIAEDQAPHPSGVESTFFRILSLSSNEEGDNEWYGKITRKWYENEDECATENPSPGPTPNGDENNITIYEEENGNDAQNGGENCVQVGGWIDLEDEGWQKYTNSNIVPGEEGAHKICFKSIDNLGNEEEEKCQVFFVDNSMPTIIPLRPRLNETTFQACAQSIVALVDDKNGIKRAWAELYNSTNDIVREVNMVLGKDKTYDALIDKQLPSGDYTLKIKAEDSIGNIGEAEPIAETLARSVFVEFISPPTCTINPEAEGQCNFKFSVCMRDANKISFSLDRLGNTVTPNMMNAEISKGQEITFVGLLDERVNSGILNLSDSIINGRTSFNLHLDIPSNVSSQIGAGSHKLDYLIKSFN